MDILRVAVDALYRAKQNGRNRVETSSEAVQEAACEAAADVAVLDAMLSQAGEKGDDADDRSNGKRQSKAA